MIIGLGDVGEKFGFGFQNFGDVSSRKLSELSVPEIRILAASVEGGLDASPAPSDDTSEHESAFSLQTTERFSVYLFRVYVIIYQINLFNLRLCVN